MYMLPMGPPPDPSKLINLFIFGSFWVRGALGNKFTKKTTQMKSSKHAQITNLKTVIQQVTQIAAIISMKINDCVVIFKNCQR